MSIEHSPAREKAPRDLSAAIAYSIDEFSEISGLGRSFIYEQIRAGKLTVHKAGKRSLILPKEAARYLVTLPTIEPSTP